MPNRVPLQTIPKLRDWPAGVTWPSGAHLQEGVDAIRALAGDSPDFSRGPDSRRVLRFPAFIDKQGPNKGDVDYTDERYWVTRVFIDKIVKASTDAIKFITEDKAIDPVLTYTAINLAEIRTHSHALPRREYVMVEGWLDHSDPQFIRYSFYREPPWRISVKGNLWTDSSALGGGVYRVRVMNAPTANFAKASGISLSTFGTEGTIDFLAANMQEQDQTTHDIDVTGTRKPTVFPARLLSIDDDEKTVAFAFDSDQWKNGC